MTNAWTGGQYSLFRIVFGGFLFVQLALLVPYAGELFSAAGLAAEYSASRLHPLFPDPALVWDSPVVGMSILVVTALASLALAIGWRDRAAALLLFVVWASLFSRNPLIAIPGLPFVGWLLLFHVALPATAESVSSPSAFQSTGSPPCRLA